MSRIGFSMAMKEIAKNKNLEHLPPVERAEAALANEAKAEAMAILSGQGISNEVLELYVRRCNFEIFEKTKCMGNSNNKIINAEITDGALIYTSLVAEGQETRVTISQPDYSDITIEARRGKSRWWRTSDGVENFTFADPVSETQWIENPDCSGNITYKKDHRLIEATWTSPNTGPVGFDYNSCLRGKCFSGKI